jgi:hypothetical protein
MAKLKMPLMGMEASGQLGKTLVYFNWKGINCARMHVVPSNPNTTAQQGRRTKFSNAVDAYHDASLSDVDVDGWRTFAGIQSSPMTYFNTYVKYHILSADASETWPNFNNDLTDSTTSEEIDFSIDGETGLTAKVRYGQSATYMPNIGSLSESSGTYTLNVASLESGAKYFYQFYVDTETYTLSGIGSVIVD